MTDVAPPPHLGLLAVHGHLEPVCVRGRDNGRLRIVDAEGTERTVSPQRLYWSGATAVPDPLTLPALWAELQRLAQRADLDAVWHILDGDGPPGEFEDPQDVARAALGDTSPLACDAIAVAAFGEPLGFRVRHRRLLREPADVVARARALREESARASRRLEQATASLGARLAGAPSPDPDPERAAAAAHFLAALADRAAHGDDAPRAAEAAAILDALRAAGAFGDDAPPDAFALLVALGAFSPDENLALHRAALRTAFPDDVLAAAAELAAAPAADTRPPRRDLRALYTLAIDDAATVEVDDALAMDGERLFVCIADVAALVRPGSPVDREAALRASTLYLPEGKVPMLPPALSFDAASLLAGQDRAAVAFSFEVAPDGRLVGLEVERALIHVDRRLDYVEADAIFADPGSTDPAAALLRRARAAMDAHRATRLRKGAVFLQRTEVALDVAPDGAVRCSPGDPYAPGRQLVSELMIATCAAAAEFCAERDIPCIYRTQARPDGPATGRGGRIDGAAQQHELLKRLKPSVLATRPGPHFTLAVDAYCQLTSPLRRYADLLMHQQLSAWLKIGRPVFSAGQLAQRFPDIERLSSLVKRVENESRRYWAIRWCEQHPEARIAGVVVRELGRRWVVELGALALQVPVAFARRVMPGEEVTLVITKAHARSDALQLALAPAP